MNTLFSTPESSFDCKTTLDTYMPYKHLKMDKPLWDRSKIGHSPSRTILYLTQAKSNFTHQRVNVISKFGSRFSFVACIGREKKI